MRDVHDGRHARHQPGQQIQGAEATGDGDSCVACALSGEADDVPSPPDDRSMEHDRIGRQDGQKQQQLGRDDAPQVSLTQREKPRGKIGVVDRAAREPLRNSAEQRERPERDDERRDAEPRDQHRVERSAGAAGQKRDRRRGRQRHMPVVVGRAEEDRGEPHHRPHRQIDAAADNDRGQRDGQQPELDAQPDDFEQVAQRKEVLGYCCEERDLGDERQQEDPFAVRQRAGPACGHQGGPAAATAA